MNIGSKLKLQSTNAGLIAALAVGVVMLFAATGLTRAQAQDLTFLAHEDQSAARLETFPERKLKGLYLRCSYHVSQGLLASGEIALCSVVYEKLLARSFGGNFDALLAWSSTQREDAFEGWLKDVADVENDQLW